MICLRFLRQIMVLELLLANVLNVHIVLTGITFLPKKFPKQKYNFAFHTGCCCVRQCSEPKPQTKSTA